MTGKRAVAAPPAAFLTWEQVLVWRVARQILAERAPAGTMLAVTAEICGLHGPRVVEWGKAPLGRTSVSVLTMDPPRSIALDAGRGDAPMIARVWRGVTRAEHADVYMDYLEETGLKDYRATPGFGGLQVLRRVADGKAEFVLITFWESRDAIRAFAGDDPERSVYYPEDDEYLLEKEPHVTHYEVPVRE